MKPILTFVLGAILAAAVATYVVKREPAVPETPAAAVPSEAAPAVQSEPVPATPAPAPVHEATPPSRRPEPRRPEPRRAAPEPAPTVASNSPLTPSSPAGAAESHTPAGPPQTTLSVPPAPETAKSVEKSPPRVAKTVTIPAGTLLNVRVDERLSSKTSQAGDSFRATLDQPVVVDGAVIAERGSRVEGRVADADPGGRVKGNATLALELVRLSTSDGQKVRLQTESFTKVAAKSTKKDALKVGIGAGLGAAIGAIAGGGKGAAIGAGVGGAAGTGAVMTTRGDAAEIPAETRVSFRLQEPITITEKLK